MIGKAVQDLLESGCGLIVATVSADGEPRAARAWAADVVDASTGRVRVLLEADDPVTVSNLTETGALAVTGGDVRTLQSVQVKGAVVAVESITGADLARVDRHAEVFFANVHETDGTPMELLERMLPASMVACVLQVSEVYDQSPGPGAGAAVRGDAR